MDQQNQQRRLGRGLSALLGGQGPTGHEATEGSHAVPSADTTQGEMVSVATDRIEPSPFQPRREFGSEELNELIGSIREHGVLAPLLVREVDSGYQLVAGETSTARRKKSRAFNCSSTSCRCCRPNSVRVCT